MRALNFEEQEFRKRKILQYVIHEYIRTGKPVGSQMISSSSRMNLSSASIRNVLTELERDELITHPHTSAGRMPTDKGYRMYVDSIIELQRLAVQEQTRVQREYESRIREIEDLMSHTSKMLASLSNYTGFVIAPKADQNVFSGIELVPVAGHRILVAMITESGMAKHFVISTNVEIPRERLRAIARIINENFRGCTLEEVKLHLLEKLRTAQEEYRDLMSLAMEIGEEIKKFSTSEIYLDGTRKILSLPDFSGTEELQNLLEFMEEKQILANLLEEEIKQSKIQNKNSKKILKRKENGSGTESEKLNRVHVRIGSENPIKALQNLSMVSSTYQLADRTIGVLGILGPKRMEYAKMMALVDYVSQMVNQVLKQFGERE